jgi:hypothetical protein
MQTDRTRQQLAEHVFIVAKFDLVTEHYRGVHLSPQWFYTASTAVSHSMFGI